MVSVGEESGQLETMLEKVADFYEAEVDAKIKSLTSPIEPLMIIMVGSVVGFIVISMYLPIFSLYDKIRWNAFAKGRPTHLARRPEGFVLLEGLRSRIAVIEGNGEGRPFDWHLAGCLRRAASSEKRTLPLL
jgi:hypothetical protein